MVKLEHKEEKGKKLPNLLTLVAKERVYPLKVEVEEGRGFLLKIVSKIGVEGAHQYVLQVKKNGLLA